MIYFLFSLLLTATSAFAVGQGQPNNNQPKPIVFVDETPYALDALFMNLPTGRAVQLETTGTQPILARDPFNGRNPFTPQGPRPTAVTIPYQVQPPTVPVAVPQAQPVITHQPAANRPVPNFNQRPELCGSLSSLDSRGSSVMGSDSNPGNFFAELNAIGRQQGQAAAYRYPQQVVNRQPVQALTANQPPYQQNIYNINVQNVVQNTFIYGPMPALPKGFGNVFPLNGNDRTVFNGNTHNPSFVATTGAVPQVPFVPKIVAVHNQETLNQYPQKSFQETWRRARFRTLAPRPVTSQTSQPPVKKVAIESPTAGTLPAKSTDLTYGEFVQLLSFLIHHENPILKNMGLEEQTQDTKHECEMLQIFLAFAFCSEFNSVETNYKKCFHKRDLNFSISQYWRKPDSNKCISDDYLEYLINLITPDSDISAWSKLKNNSTKITAILRQLIGGLIDNSNPNFGIHDQKSVCQKYVTPNNENFDTLYNLLQTVRFYVKENSHAAELLLQARQTAGSCKPKEIIVIEEEDDDEDDFGSNGDHTMPPSASSFYSSTGSTQAKQSSSGAHNAVYSNWQLYSSYSSTQALSHVVVTLLSILMQPKNLEDRELAEPLDLAVF